MQYVLKTNHDLIHPDQKKYWSASQESLSITTYQLQVNMPNFASFCNSPQAFSENSCNGKELYLHCGRSAFTHSEIDTAISTGLYKEKKT